MAKGDSVIKFENWTVIITSRCSDALKEDMINAIKHRSEK